jgi:predicted kinase
MALGRVFVSDPAMVIPGRPAGATRPARADDASGWTWPPDALVLLVGAAGCGKSTWAAQRFAPSQVLSSDAFRAIVAGDAADQSATSDAFRLLHQAVRARLRRGLLTIVDATNLTAASRRGLLGYAKRAGRPGLAVVFDVPLARCLEQNAARTERQVPEDVVRRHHRALQGTMALLPREGYAEIRVVTADEVSSTGSGGLGSESTRPSGRTAAGL